MRHELTLEPVTLEAFCALATERARLRDPAFPALTPAGLEVISKWAYGWWREVRTPAWHLWEEDLDDGPAEAIHVSRWRATATLGETRLLIAFERVHTTVRVWEEVVE